IGRALHIDSAEPVCVVRAVWATRVEPAAHATTYLPAEMAGPFMGGPPPRAAEAEGPAAAGPASTPATAAPADRTADAALSLQPLTSAPALPQALWGDIAAMGKPAALHIEMQLPPPSVARSLRLTAGQPAAMVTVRFDDPATGRAVCRAPGHTRSRTGNLDPLCLPPPLAPRSACRGAPATSSRVAPAVAVISSRRRPWRRCWRICCSVSSRWCWRSPSR